MNVNRRKESEFTAELLKKIQQAGKSEFTAKEIRIFASEITSDHLVDRLVAFRRSLSKTGLLTLTGATRNCVYHFNFTPVEPEVVSVVPSIEDEPKSEANPKMLAMLREYFNVLNFIYRAASNEDKPKVCVLYTEITDRCSVRASAAYFKEMQIALSDFGISAGISTFWNYKTAKHSGGKHVTNAVSVDGVMTLRVALTQIDDLYLNACGTSLGFKDRLTYSGPHKEAAPKSDAEKLEELKSTLPGTEAAKDLAARIMLGMERETPKVTEISDKEEEVPEETKEEVIPEAPAKEVTYIETMFITNQESRVTEILGKDNVSVFALCEDGKSILKVRIPEDKCYALSQQAEVDFVSIMPDTAARERVSEIAEKIEREERRLAAIEELSLIAEARRAELDEILRKLAELKGE